MKVSTLKGDKVYLTKSPAQMIDTNIETVLRIKMSCGGGMGGSSWYETVKPIEIVPHSLIEVETLDGETKLINTDFVVNAVEKQLITVTEVHQNTNFKETMGKELDYHYLAPMNVRVKFMGVHKYTDDWLVR